MACAVSLKRRGIPVKGCPESTGFSAHATFTHLIPPDTACRFARLISQGRQPHSRFARRPVTNLARHQGEGN